MYSVVLPVYNSEKTIEDVLESIRNQTRYDLIEEIIIINDGSTDNTDKVILEYINMHSEMNIKYLKQKNRGVSYARNRAIKMAKSKWIALIDSDDIWHKNKIERQDAILKSNKDILFLGAAYPLKILFRKINGLYKMSAKELCIRNLPCTPTIVFDRETGIDLGLYDEQMLYGEDVNFYQKFLLKDSYYVLAENLVDIGIGKKFFAQSGLSSNLYEMHLGRNRNTTELYRMHLISFPFYSIMMLLNWIKFFRRVTLRKVDAICSKFSMNR